MARQDLKTKIIIKTKKNNKMVIKNIRRVRGYGESGRDGYMYITDVYINNKLLYRDLKVQVKNMDALKKFFKKAYPTPVVDGFSVLERVK